MKFEMDDGWLQKVVKESPVPDRTGRAKVTLNGTSSLQLGFGCNSPMRRIRLSTVSVWLFSLTLADASGVFAQEAGTLRGRTESATLVEHELEPTAPVANLFARSDEGLMRRDWKLVIDSLQRIIEEPEGSLMPRPHGAVPGGAIYESARLQAIRQISTLPPEGLNAYRLLYDGSAKGIFDRARAANDTKLLGEVVERFLLTRYGDDAAELLASHALDSGRPAECIRILTELLDAVPDSDVPAELIYGKLAVAGQLVGRPELTRQAMESLKRHLGSTPLPAWLTEGDLRVNPLHVTAFGMKGETATFVTPLLSERVPWRYTHNATRNESQEIVHAAAHDGSLDDPPTQIYLRSTSGCVALNADDLQMLWQWPAPDSDLALAMRSRLMTTSGEGPAAEGLLKEPQQWVTTSDGLVYAALTSMGTILASEDAGAGGGWLIQPGGIRPGRSTSDALTPTWLTAWDGATGRLLWSSGLVEAASSTDAAECLGPPLVVDGNLWMLAAFQQELFVAVVDALHGSLIRRITLCPIEGTTASPKRAALQPSYADGVVYVPTAEGFLFAVDSTTLELVWAARYPTRRSREYAGGRWVGAQPRVIGDAVLYAPPGGPELLAFSASNGDFRWSLPTADLAEVIGSDESSVYVIAESHTVTRISAADGHTVWQIQLPRRAIGPILIQSPWMYVPTSDALCVLSLQSGEVAGNVPLSASEHPLNQIVVTPTALYSVDEQGMRLYPDLSRSYPRAVERNKLSAHKAETTLRLAWLELLREDPKTVLIMLDGAAGLLNSAGTGLSLEAARLRVEALLDLASQKGASATDVRELLDQAAAAARSDEDRLRCGLARADHKAAVGESRKAFEILWSTAVSVDGGLRLRSQGQPVELNARRHLIRRMGESLTKLGPDDSEALKAWAEKEVANLSGLLNESTKRRGALSSLRVLAQVPELGTPAIDATLRVAHWELAQSKGEQAEQTIQEALRRIGGGVEAESARARLVALGTSAAKGFEALEVEAVDWQVRPSEELPLPRLVTFSGNPGSVLQERLIVYGADDVVHALNPRNPYANQALGLNPPLKFFWSSPLRLLEQFENLTEGAVRKTTERVRRAVADGQIAVFNSRDGLFALGLLTGKRLWAIPYEDSGTRGKWVRSDHQMACLDGMLAAIPRAGFLSLIHIADGSTVWERDLLGERVGFVWMFADRIITADPLGERVAVFDRADGRLIGRDLFRQPQSDGPRLPLVLADGVLCGSDWVDGVSQLSGVDVRDGQKKWTIALDKPLAHVFQAYEGFVGAGILQGELKIIRAKSGEVVMDRCVPTAHGVADVLMVDGTLLAREVGAGPSGRVSVHALDVATGDVVWSRTDLASRDVWNRPLRLHEGSLPLIVEAGEGRKPKAKNLGLARVDVKTGKDLGPVLAVSSTDGPAALNGDWDFRSGFVVLGTNQGLRGIVLEPLNPSAAGGPNDPASSGGSK